MTRANDGAFEAFRSRPYRLFWSSAVVSNTGTWLNNLTVPYVLYQITGDAIWVGIASLAQWGPQVVLGPWAGALADRYERKRVLLVGQTFMALAAAALAVCWGLGLREPALVVGVVSVLGLFSALTGPAWQAFINDLVPPESLRSAVSLNGVQYNLARLFGPALGGVLLAVSTPTVIFALNAASFAFVLVALVAIRPVVAHVPAPRGGSALAGFGEALRYVRTQPGIAISIALACVLGLFGNPIFTLVVVLAEDVYEASPLTLGILTALIGLGGILATPFIAGGRRSLSTIVRFGLALYAAALILLGSVPHVAAGVAGMFAVGIAYMAVNSSLNTAIQSIVADRIRGRVFAVRLMVFLGSIPLGTMLLSWVSDVATVRVACAAAGACLGVSLLVASLPSRSGGLRRLDDPKDEECS